MHTTDSDTIAAKPNRTHKGAVAGAIIVSVVLGFAGLAGATPPPSDAETIATAAGTSFKDTGIAVITVLVPLAVGLIVAKRAFNMARGWVS